MTLSRDNNCPIASEPECLASVPTPPKTPHGEIIPGVPVYPAHHFHRHGCPVGRRARQLAVDMGGRRDVTDSEAGAPAR